MLMPALGSAPHVAPQQPVTEQRHAPLCSAGLLIEKRCRSPSAKRVRHASGAVCTHTLHSEALLTRNCHAGALGEGGV